MTPCTDDYELNNDDFEVVGEVSPVYAQIVLKILKIKQELIFVGVTIVLNHHQVVSCSYLVIKHVDAQEANSCFPMAVQRQKLTPWMWDLLRTEGLPTSSSWECFVGDLSPGNKAGGNSTRNHPHF